MFKRPPNFFVKGRISDRYFLNIYQALQRRPFHLSHLLEKVKYLPQTPHYLKRNDVYSVTFWSVVREGEGGGERAHYLDLQPVKWVQTPLNLLSR